MTCIVGIVGRDGTVFMGADSMAMDGGYVAQVRKDAKVFKRGPYLMGFTDSFRMGQLLRFAGELPKPRTDDLYAFMCTEFVDAARKILKDGGFATKDKEEERGGTFLVATLGRLFRVCGDYQVAETTWQYDAIGCAEQIALGSLYGSHELGEPERIELALFAATQHSGGVRGPYTIIRHDPGGA